MLQMVRFLTEMITTDDQRRVDNITTGPFSYRDDLHRGLETGR